MNRYVTWVVGRGLIGEGIHSQADMQFFMPKIRWDDKDLDRVFAKNSQSFKDFAGTRPWALIWAAGQGVIRSDSEQHQSEARNLHRLLKAIQMYRPKGPGILVLISSAGGIYGGSVSAPFDEDSAVRPRSVYGEVKIQQEAMMISYATAMGASSLILRVANVYGVNQDMRKPQGLISYLCRSAVTKQPVSIYVSTNTTRHYIFNEDLSRFVHRAVDRCLTGLQPLHVMKVVASQQSATIADVIQIVQNVSGTAVSVNYCQDQRDVFEPLDLRFRSKVWTDLDELISTPLDYGVKKILEFFRYPDNPKT